MEAHALARWGAVNAASITSAPARSPVRAASAARRAFVLQPNLSKSIRRGSLPPADCSATCGIGAPRFSGVDRTWPRRELSRGRRPESEEDAVSLSLRPPATVPLTRWTPLVDERGQLAGVHRLDEAVSNSPRQAFADKSPGNELFKQRQCFALQRWTAAQKLVQGFGLP